MRLFTGIALPDDIIDRVARLLDELRPLAPVKWSPAANLHITTKFIGPWTETNLPALRDTLEAIDPPGPFSVTLARFGFFPNPHSPKVFFIGVRAGEGLAELARRTDVAVGLPEDRPYSPHLTLARIRTENISALREQIASISDQNFGTFEASEFHLYESIAGAYRRLASFPLRATVSHA